MRFYGTHPDTQNHVRVVRRKKFIREWFQKHKEHAICVDLSLTPHYQCAHGGPLIAPNAQQNGRKPNIEWVDPMPSRLKGQKMEEDNQEYDCPAHDWKWEENWQRWVCEDCGATR